MASIISASTTSGTALNMSADTTGVLQLATGATPTTAVTIDTSQNVGIGTTSPNCTFQVNGIARAATANDKGVISLGESAGGTSVNCGLWRGDANSSLSGGIVSTGGNYLNLGGYAGMVFTTGAANIGSQTERMRIDSVGRPLFNTTSALNAGYMSLLFDGQTYNGFTLKTSYATTGSVYLYFINSAGNVAGFVSQNGTTTVSYTTSSDYRLKENIVPMTGALDKVLQLKPVNYTWKQDGTNGQGFIAHELQAIVPDAVVGEKDAVDEEGNPKYQGVDTSFLVATLTAAIQEQQTLIVSQSELINSLTARVTALEAK